MIDRIESCNFEAGAAPAGISAGICRDKYKGKQEKAVKEPDGWIPVKERLPESGEPVIVWCDGSDQAGIAWMRQGAWYMPEPQAIGYESITHWMPLPAAPEVKP